MSPAYPRFNQPRFGNQPPETQEKIVSSLCYLSFGIVGVLYIIFSGRNSQSQFFRFNFLQAIFLWIVCTLLGWAENALMSILSGVFGLAGGAMSNVLMPITSGIDLITQIIAKIMYLFLLYGCLWTLLGKNCEIPFVSKIVRQQMR